MNVEAVWEIIIIKLLCSNHVPTNIFKIYFLLRATNKLETRISDTDVKVVKVEGMTSNLGNFYF